ncbi:Na+:solute symporter [Chitinophaga sp. SYP-B3965]|uniref:sodium:solute symporter family transporter n=1 Tax=Chitinophaga sp. SYP-B3965 TaxID=2663120 RepID=UPI001299AB87|nr:Na+:solute symporter [Chitinophaga sp. SYP-B3965]MRG45052.1 Na+:solute symporter [Chitinophaga sp. SYP-B3965]
MEQVDYFVLAGYFLLLLMMGIWGYTKIKSSADFYTAGGKLPWWLSGISHHVSGYSGAVFVAYAAVAYNYGLTLYIWWALSIAIAMVGTTFLIAPRWARLRTKTNVQSPTEYLAVRYNLPTQQVMAWSGVIIKLFDVGAKWASIGILLNAFTGIPISTGIAVTGMISIFYITLGGLWADVVNDLASFIIQFVAGIFMLVIVLTQIGDGFSGIFSMWDRLPASHSAAFSGPYTPLFAISFMVICFFSFSGGTWHFATRFISSPSGSDARKAAGLSTLLFLIWPLVLFFPMFAAPLFLKDLADPSQSYALMALKFLPHGLLGLLLASMFGNTLAMTAADANTISAVITRDILPVLYKKAGSFQPKKMLLIARVTTFLFVLCTLIIAFESGSFGGVLGLIITWFSSLIGPTAVPMILGLLPAFRRSGSMAALLSICGGLLTFVATKLLLRDNMAVGLAAPISVSLVIYISAGFFNRGHVKREATELLDSIKEDD